jgi:hypothetical protein
MGKTQQQSTEKRKRQKQEENVQWSYKFGGDIEVAKKKTYQSESNQLGGVVGAVSDLAVSKPNLIRGNGLYFGI